MHEDTRERQKSKLVPGKLGPKTASMFGPLVPQSDRPIFLPGGRKWKTPKDAFNDDFIKEVISSQAELIVGSTLGYVLEQYCQSNFVHFLIIIVIYLHLKSYQTVYGSH